MKVLFHGVFLTLFLLTEGVAQEITPDQIPAEDMSLDANCNGGHCSGATIHTWDLSANLLTFGVHGTVPYPCNRFGREFAIDTTTEHGKALYSTFLSFYMADKSFTIWSNIPADAATCTSYDHLAQVRALGK